MLDVTTRRVRLGLSLLAVVLVAAVGAGCGGEGGSEESAAPGSQSSPASDTAAGTDIPAERTAEATEAAAKDAETVGGKVDPPKDKLIAFLWLSKSTEASVRLHEDLTEAAALFDFKVVDCDPNFDPAKTAQCATSLVAQNPSLIISAASATAALGGGLKTAHDRDIPWIMVGAVQTPSPYYTAQYVPDERQLTKVLDEWLFEEIEKRHGEEPGVVAAFQAPAVGAGVIARDEQRAEDLKAFPNLTEETHDIDLADAVQDTLQTTKQFVEQNPDLVALWQTCDFCAPPMAEALDQLGRTGDDRPLTAAIYTTKQSRDMIASERFTGAVENNFGAQAFVALDQALEFWARDKPFAEDNSVFSGGYGIEILEPWIVTKDNVGDPGVVRNQGEDYKAYFKAKWAAEFGVGE